MVATQGLCGNNAFGLFHSHKRLLPLLKSKVWLFNKHSNSLGCTDTLQKARENIDSGPNWLGGSAWARTYSCVSSIPQDASGKPHKPWGHPNPQIA